MSVSKFSKKRLFSFKLVALIIIIISLTYSTAITCLYFNKKSKSSDYYEKQSKDVVLAFEDEKTFVVVLNQIDEYAYVKAGAQPPGGGGGWGVVKKENGQWINLFWSSDAVYCEYYKKYDLPKNLVGDCELWNDSFLSKETFPL